MTKWKLLISTLLVIATLQSGVRATAAPVEVKVDVVQAMKEFASWVAAGFNQWDIGKQNDIKLAIPRIVQDLTALATLKDVVATDLKQILPMIDRLSRSSRPFAADSTPAERASEPTLRRHLRDQLGELQDKLDADTKRMKRILARLQTHVEDIDPRWSEKNLDNQSAVVGIAEGYGTLMLYVNRVNEGVSSGGDTVRADGSALVTDLVREATRLREIAAALTKATR